MQSLSEFSVQVAKSIQYVLADIDDTITSEGLLPASSLQAMERLQAAGIKVIPVTGRPAGWCDHIARMWPVEGVVGENGAVFMAYDRIAKRMQLGFAKDESARKADRQRLEQLAMHILGSVPGSGIASDQPYRIADLAIDFCEDVPPLSEAEIAQIVDAFEAAGATAKVSSIHVNGWFGQYDKLSMSKRLFAEAFGVQLADVQPTCVYVGDSPNDQPMFDYFDHAVGVANVHDFALTQPPKWVTQGRSAEGFRQLAEQLLNSR